MQVHPRIAKRQFEVLELGLIEQQVHEREGLMTGRSEDMPSEMQRRHAKEWAELQTKKPKLEV